jgi:hypothetical protein
LALLQNETWSAAMKHSDLRELRSQYESAYALYQNYVAAFSLAQGGEEGASADRLSGMRRAIEDLRAARRRYRAARMQVAFGS